MIGQKRRLKIRTAVPCSRVPHVSVDLLIAFCTSSKSYCFGLQKCLSCLTQFRFRNQALVGGIKRNLNDSNRNVNPMNHLDFDLLPIAVRVYPESPETKPRGRSERTWRLPKAMLVFDTETRIDA